MHLDIQSREYFLVGLRYCKSKKICSSGFSFFGTLYDKVTIFHKKYNIIWALSIIVLVVSDM